MLFLKYLYWSKNEISIFRLLYSLRLEKKDDCLKLDREIKFF